MVKRTYRQKKENPWLSVCITQIRGLLQKVFQPYCLALYKVISHEENKQFLLPRHGNAKDSHGPPYFRQDPANVASIDEKLRKGWSTEKVYINLTKEETDTLSETLKKNKNNQQRRV